MVFVDYKTKLDRKLGWITVSGGLEGGKLFLVSYLWAEPP